MLSRNDIFNISINVEEVPNIEMTCHDSFKFNQKAFKL